MKQFYYAPAVLLFEFVLPCGCLSCQEIYPL